MTEQQKQMPLRLTESQQQALAWKAARSGCGSINKFIVNYAEEIKVEMQNQSHQFYKVTVPPAKILKNELPVEILVEYEPSSPWSKISFYTDPQDFLSETAIIIFTPNTPSCLRVSGVKDCLNHFLKEWFSVVQLAVAIAELNSLEQWFDRLKSKADSLGWQVEAVDVEVIHKAWRGENG